MNAPRAEALRSANSVWMPTLFTLALLLICLAAWAFADSPPRLTALGAAVVVLPVALCVPLRWLILLPFTSVIWLGEGFHWSERFPLSPHVLLMALVMAVAVCREQFAFLNTLLRHRAFLVFLAMVGIALSAGLLGEADTQVVKEDVTPFLYFAAGYVLAATCFRRLADAAWLARAVVWLTALAVVKLLYLSIAAPAADWFNQWQALVERGPGPLETRIILRGADVFWFAGAALLLGQILVTPGLARKLQPLALLGVMSAGMFFSATRSNWLGFGVAVLAQLLLVVHRGTISRRQLATLAGALLTLGLVVAAAESQPEYSLSEKVRARFDQPRQDMAVNVRVSEARALLDSMQWNFLVGRGMGSEYDYVDDLGGTLRTSWSHNGFLFLYLKLGVTGLGAYLFLLYGGLRAAWRGSLAAGSPEELSEWLGLLGALTCVAVLSLAVNKIFAVSGALFCGMVLGTLVNRRVSARTRLGKVRD
jgi:O-antigen ligase